MANSFIDYCERNSLPIKFTSIIRPGIIGVSVSKTHMEGRAFDCSVKGWSEKDIKFCEAFFNEKYSSIGAIPFGSLQGLPCVYEDGKTHGTAPHFHFQVRATL